MRKNRVRAYLTEHNLEAVWFASPSGFSWLTGGRNVVSREGSIGVAAAGHDGERLLVVTNNIEAERLSDEELPECEVIEFDWYDSDLATEVAEASPTPAAADFDVPRFDRVDAAALRQPLAERDVEDYRDLGRDVAAAVESVCYDLEPSDTESAVATRLRTALGERGIESPVALVGGEVRAQKYRHFTPKDVPLGGYAIASVTAERGGLFASTTRTVAFDPPEWLAERQRAAARVETTALTATRDAGRTGGTAGDVFGAIQDAYAAQGYEGEWKLHHQGGAAGFSGREWIGTPGNDARVHLPQGYAWNPTVQGAKSEDTVLVTEDGFEVLTQTGDWPTDSVEAIGYGVEIERHAIVEL